MVTVPNGFMGELFSIAFFLVSEYFSCKYAVQQTIGLCRMK